jgi:hypothetical protein
MKVENKVMRRIPLMLLAILICGCNHQTKTEKYQNDRSNVINVREHVKEIQINDVLIGNSRLLCLLNDYLIIVDLKGYKKIIHIFNKDTYHYLGSTATLGQGPGEITNLVDISADPYHGKLYVTDDGKRKIFSYDIDSVLQHPNYMPSVKMNLNKKRIPLMYEYFSDTLSVGIIGEVTSPRTFNSITARWNMSTGEIEPMKYTHPKIERKRINIASSQKYNIYVEGYNYHDLLTICSLDGHLKYNIYGSKWDSKTSNRKAYYRSILFCKDKILVLYANGKDNHGPDRLPTSILVFDLEGNYIKTIDVGYKLIRACYDEENNRIIFSLADEMQFAYLPLDEIL